MIYDIDNEGMNESRKEIGHFEFTIAKLMTSLNHELIGDLKVSSVDSENRGKVILRGEPITCYSINEVSLHIQCNNLKSKKKCFMFGKNAPSFKIYKRIK